MKKAAGLSLRNRKPTRSRSSGYLPKQMSDADVAAAIDAAIKETGAAGVKDMGKVIGVLKGKYAGQMDFGKASGLVKGKLG